jgi:hypothetical protein
MANRARRRSPAKPVSKIDWPKALDATAAALRLLTVILALFR